MEHRLKERAAVRHPADDAGSAPPKVGTHCVQVPEYGGVGLHGGRLGVADPMVLAGPLDHTLRAVQVGPRHAREQVVLDLIVETAHQHLRDSTAPDVARGEHLPEQRVRGQFGSEDRHALVPRCERATQVDPEERLVHNEKDQRLLPGQGDHRQGHIRRDVHDEQHRLDLAVPQAGRRTASPPERCRFNASRVRIGTNSHA